MVWRDPVGMACSPERPRLDEPVSAAAAVTALRCRSYVADGEEMCCDDARHDLRMAASGAASDSVSGMSVRPFGAAFGAAFRAGDDRLGHGLRPAMDGAY
jgi:hypothetical protein